MLHCTVLCIGHLSGVVCTLCVFTYDPVCVFLLSSPVFPLSSNAKLFFPLCIVSLSLSLSVFACANDICLLLLSPFSSLFSQLVARRLVGCPAAERALALLRRHPPPSQKKLQQTLALIARLGCVVDPTSAGTIHKSLEALTGKKHATGFELKPVGIVFSSLYLLHYIICNSSKRLLQYIFFNGSSSLYLLQ